MSDNVFEDEEGNEFVFVDEDECKNSGSSYKSSSASCDDDSSEEEWIFEDMSDEEEDSKPTSRPFTRTTSAPVSRTNSLPNQRTTNATPSRLLKKFSSNLRADDVSGRKNAKSSPDDITWADGEELLELPELGREREETTKTVEKKTQPKPSAVSQDRIPMPRRMQKAVTSNSRIKQTKPTRQSVDLPQIKSIKPKDEEQADLADQIAALRIIASKGKDAKYLSIRGNVQIPTPAPVRNESIAAPKSDARSRIVDEIVTTEETYVNDLEILIRLYLEPLSTRKNKKKKPIITREQVKGLFSNIESILNLNRVLLADLQKQIELPPEEQRIGAAFNLLAKCLLIYTDYCSNQKNADDLYTKLKHSNDQFVSLLTENQAKPESRRLDLNAFLIKPVQRACKYPLLLRELLKETPESHPDYNDLKEAFEAMQESCLKLNERKRDVENMSHFLTIKARTGKNFIEQGRTFIDDGNISMITEKFNRRSSKMKFRLRKGRYVLFSDMVVFISEGKVIAQISLSTCQIQEAKLPGNSFSFLFFFFLLLSNFLFFSSSFGVDFSC